MATIVSPRTTTSSPAPTPAPSQSQTQTYFNIVMSNLIKLGALTLEDFLHDPYQEPAPQETSSPIHSTTMCLSHHRSSSMTTKTAVRTANLHIRPHQYLSLPDLLANLWENHAADYETIKEESKESECLPAPSLSKPTHRCFPFSFFLSPPPL